MPKGTEQHKNSRKKPKFTLKEKRLRKKEKKHHGEIQHEVRDVYEE